MNANQSIHLHAPIHTRTWIEAGRKALQAIIAALDHDIEHSNIVGTPEQHWCLVI